MTKTKWPSKLRRRDACAALLIPAAFVGGAAFADEGPSGPITVKVPVEGVIDRASRFAGFRYEFTRTARKGEATEYYRLSVKELPSGELQFHRRNDNGVAGSGVVATVKYTREESPSETSMTFEQASTSTYQEGLFLKKPVPAFSLKEVLLGGVVNVRFELDSDYAVDAVRANFKRMAMLAGVPGGKEMWRLTTPSGQQYLQLEFFPYRTGSKVTGFASIAGRETAPGVIDFGRLIQEVQAAVRTIIQA